VTYAAPVPVLFQRVESAAVALAVVVGFVAYGFAWWWLLALFLAWDLSMLGYLVSSRTGAWTYNVVHSYIGPGVLLSHALLTGARWSAFVALAWAFHIAADRLLGYGLKLTTSFQHTHLGELGSGKTTPPPDRPSR
jgi:hypothetical protein